MRYPFALIGLLAVAGCTDTTGGTAVPVGGPQVAETVPVTLDSTLYTVSFSPAGQGFSSPVVAVERAGGAFMAGDKDKALAVAQKYCDGTGRAPASDAPMSAARVNGKWEFTNLCR
jgi:hypothetical protein